MMIPFAMTSITIIAALVRMHQMLSFEVRKRWELVTTIAVCMYMYVCMYV